MLRDEYTFPSAGALLCGFVLIYLGAGLGLTSVAMIILRAPDASNPSRNESYQSG